MKAQWIAAYAAAQKRAIPELLLPGTAGKTNRTHFHAGLSGHAYRIVLGELYGTQATTYRQAVVKIGGKKTTLTFNGKEDVVVPPGGLVASDPVQQEVSPADEVELWLYNGGQVSAQSACQLQQAHSKEGNFAGMDFEPEITPIKFPPNVQLELPEGFGEWQTGFSQFQILADEATDAGNIVAFGDSITEMDFWTAPLQNAIHKKMPCRTLLNMGIGGNRLLYDSHMPLAPHVQLFGRSGLARMQWDLLQIPGTRAAILALGINDIAAPGGQPANLNPGMDELPDTGKLIDGFRQFIRCAHEAGIKVAGCTITPFKGFANYDEVREEIRKKVNEWILFSKDFDMTIDFAKAICDKAHPEQIQDGLHIGDHLHPNASGGRKMAEAVDLERLLELC